MSGIAYTVGITPQPNNASHVFESTNGGAAAGDCDGDGDIDLFITAGDAGTGANRLYLNQLYLNRQGLRGNPLQFVDVAASADVDPASSTGIAYTRSKPGQQNFRHSGPTFADMDGDGDLDLFLGAIYDDPLRIFENDGNCRFRDVTANSPGIVAMQAATTISAAFGDHDLDGDVDLFLTHWGTTDATYAAHPVWTTEHLWENRSVPGRIEYVNVSVGSGVSAATRSTRDIPDSFGRQQEGDFTFAPSIARIDGDLWPDIAIAADYGTSQLLLGNADGTFRDSGLGLLLRTAQFGMGSALGDFDNDGDLDWFVSSIMATDPHHLGNRLYRNRENGTGVFNLTDDTEGLGVAAGGWGWGSCFLDIDNDRDLDIYHVNGWFQPFMEQSYRNDPSVVYIWQGVNYVESAQRLGLDSRHSARGVVCADFDEDGDIDLLELSNRQPNSGLLWENRTAAAGRNFLRVKLHGLTPNTEASGARIYVTAGGVTQMREVMIGSNYISQNPTVQNFGLGDASTVESVRVVWPARVPAPGSLPVQPAPTVLPNAAQPTINVNGLLTITQAP